MAINAPSPLKNEWKTLTAKLIVSVLFLFSNSSNFPLSDIALRKKKNHPREQSESWRGDSIFSVFDSDSCIQKTEKRCGLFRFGLWVVKEHCADWARDGVAQNWSNSPGQILQDVRLLCKVMSIAFAVTFACSQFATFTIANFKFNVILCQSISYLLDRLYYTDSLSFWFIKKNRNYLEMLKLIHAVSVGFFDVCENMICSHYERASEKQKKRCLFVIRVSFSIL